MHRSVVRCQSCRHHVLDTFAALAGVSLRPSPQVKWSELRTPATKAAARSFSTSSSFSQTRTEQSESEKSSGSGGNAPIPWYLQVETPTPPAPSSPHLALQEIPQIPPDAPVILSPILNHLSNQVGLDNLSLIDLRHLDPPPALGANLIMILGTARSYKHLNTSADRFCRWLRSRYKLQPYADGLLGRNEMKLKLRRRARKMKLAQSVGNTVAVSEADDGITTGWICVNMGTVDNARIPEDEKQRLAAEAEAERVKLTEEQQEEIEAGEEEYENPADDYIGFGSRSLAPRIVVQMFTEQKRLEMDLEGLWDVRMERKVKKAEKMDADEEAAGPYVQDGDTTESSASDSGTQFRPFAGHK